MAGELRRSIDNFGKSIKDFFKPVGNVLDTVGKGVKNIITLGGNVPIEVTGTLLNIKELESNLKGQGLSGVELETALAEARLYNDQIAAKQDQGFVTDYSKLGTDISPEGVDSRMVSLATDTTIASAIKPQEAVYEALAAKVLKPNETIADGMTRKNEFFRYQDAITVDPEIDTDNYITIKVGA